MTEYVTQRRVLPHGGGTDSEPPFRYDARLANQIELAWQDRWAERGTFHAPNPVGPLSAGFEQVKGRPKFYVLDMFAYPSGAGLHVGHAVGYISTDAYARFLRMTGYAVLHPYGYDAFGLPAEQYAIDTGQHPAVTTRSNIGIMRRQLRRLGLGHDPRREIATSDPGFYRWTQWIFLQIWGSWFDENQGRARPIADLVTEFEAGTREPAGQANPESRPWAELDELTRRQVVDGRRLAYISEEMVNWCPELGTVLANEEVTADGRSQVGNYPVYRRPLRQWMLRITAYADRLLEDLDALDWPEPIKVMQRNWIGRSDGAIISFPVTGGAARAASSGGGSGSSAPAVIAAFTTRPDTLPGATYLVLAPEHPLVDDLVAASWPAGTPQAWRFTGGQTDPGAGWPPAAAVAAYREHAAAMGDRQRTISRDKTGVFTGCYATNPATGGQIPVFLADYVLMGYGTGAIMAVPAHDDRDLAFAREFGLPVTAVLPPLSSWVTGTDEPAATEAAAEAATGAATEAATQWLEQSGHGIRRRMYRMRDWLFSRQRYWGEPFPIVYDRLGMPVALPEDLLPVTLPEMTDFRSGPPDSQTGDPLPPLARARDWAQVELDLGDGRQVYRRELNTMPQWAGSCWYYLRYLDPANDTALVDPQIERYWMVPEGAAPGDGGVDLYVGGAEHAVLHLLYARFWHKVLFDLGHVSTREPFRRLLNQGMILADAFTDARGRYVPAAGVQTLPDGSHLAAGQPVTRRAGKMGKSLKNGISPDEMYQAYGADTLRLYEMALGPLDVERPWQTDDVVGVYRFLQRLWRNLIDEQTGEVIVDDGPLDPEMSRHLHATISAVREHFAGLRFNIGIARLQELNSAAARLAAARGTLPRALAEPLVLMVAPLAPHIAEELWARLGHGESVSRAAFPQADDELAAELTVVVPVQVNGRIRFRIEVPAQAGEELTSQILHSHPDFARHVGPARVERLVIVPGRIVSVVTAQEPGTGAATAGAPSASTLGHRPS
jgi:leucyl-tRNA synthetase